MSIPESDTTIVDTLSELKAQALPQNVQQLMSPGGTTVLGAGKEFSKVRRMSRSSTMLDIGGKGFLDEIEQVCRKYDSNGDGNFSILEVKNIVADLRDQEKQTKSLKKMLFVVTASAIAFCAIMLGLMFTANEASKDVRPTGAELRTTGSNSKVVKTGSVESFASLFDLPKFDSRTLSKIDYLTLALDKNSYEATFKISGAVKKNGHSYVTFLTEDGSKIVVDGANAKAVATVQGKQHIIDGTMRKARLLKQGGYKPRLFSEDEFFAEDNGFTLHRDKDGSVIGRRLNEDADHGGWASLSLSAGRALLDFHIKKNGVAHENIHMHGILTIQRDPSKAVTTDLQTEVFYSSNSNASKIRMHVPGDITTLYDYHLNYLFTFQKDGTLSKCQHVEAPSFLEIIKQADAMVVTDGGKLLSGVQADGTEYMFSVENFALDADLDAVVSLQSPSADDCSKLRARSYIAYQPLGNTTHHLLGLVSGSRRRLSERITKRRLGWSGIASDKQLWDAAYGAYKGNGAVPGWYTWKECEAGNAYAKFLYKHVSNGYAMVIAFAGTDGLSDFGDWKNNLNIQPKTYGNRKVHKGFYDYQNALAHCIDGYRSQLSGWNINVAYSTGHSLGGAAATLYEDMHPTTHGAWTYGAPKTRYDQQCEVKGKRFAHQNDAIASNVMGIMGSLNHNIQNAVRLYDESYCSSSCWIGCCPWGWKNRRKSGTQNCNQDSGGCSWLVDCAYNFATVHSAYGDYL
jgi:hypothetical protein